MAAPSPLWELTAVPAEWPFETVVDAWAVVAGTLFNDSAVRRGLRAAQKALESRLEELWASQPQDVQRWFAQHLELYFQQRLHGKTEEEQLRQVLHQRCWRSPRGKSHFSAAGLVAAPWPPCVEWRGYSPTPTQNLARRLVAARGPVEAEAEAKRRRVEATTSTEELQAKAEERLRTELVEAQKQREALTAQLAEAEAAKAAELRAAQEECGRLTDGLAVAASELQAVREELETCREQCQQLEHRAVAAEAEAADSQSKLLQAQEKSCEYRERCEQLQKRLALSEAASGHSPDLQNLLVEHAVYKDRCEQLSEQIKQQTDRNMGQIHSLLEEKGMYKERCRHLQRQLADVKEEAKRLGALHPTFAQDGEAALSSEDLNSNVETDYILVDDETLSELSLSSWFSVKPHCFMLDAIFKTRSGDTVHFLPGRELMKGSQVVAGDDKTILEVAEVPKVCKATEAVQLQAGAATLQVTRDHLVQVADAKGELGGGLYLPAGDLKPGNLVVLDSGEAEALTTVKLLLTDCEVLKIVFEPDLPVAVFSRPPCILSKGHKKKPPIRRRGFCPRTKGTMDETADGRVSIPITAGEYMD